MKFSLSAAVCFLGLAVASQSPAQDIVGLPYAKAREMLIAEGARPLLVERSEADSAPCVHPDGDWCRRWPELQDCAGTGAGACLFAFRAADGGQIHVITAGEIDPHVTTIMPAR